ncbi:hypothetical protein [Actinacidiphila acidipaludis]|uniref:hypothetical protein n=1 Tax=Actinacidiphila acidipaludis TaxID=2873382 RepID=UPI00223C16D3|nr:hypothetical protein [Streptomyces acidipaludis]
MGYSVLYVAFGIVALWLLGEVLLQYKARLRWRVLAFAGFLCVVVGVYGRQVPVILLGAIAFGTGQAFVTLSYKRGFSTGWALGGRPGSSRRRRGTAPRAEPVLEVTPVEAGHDADDPAAPAAQDVLTGEQDRTEIYQPVPMHEDSGEYPLYDGRSTYTPDPYTSGGYEGYGAQGYEGWGGTEPQPAAAAASYDSGGYQGGYGGYDTSGGWGAEQAYGYGQDGYQQPAAASYDPNYGGGYQGGGFGEQATGEWTPQPHPQHPEGPYAGQQAPADPYGAYGYEPQQTSQPYIPQQPHQSPYEQPAPHQQSYDPYDPYRY